MTQNALDDKSTLVEGTKPLPRLMLTQIYMVSLGHSELTHWCQNFTNHIFKCIFFNEYYIFV